MIPNPDDARMSAKRPLRSSVVTTLSNLSKRSVAARSDHVRLLSCRLTRQFETYTLLIPEIRLRVQVAQSFDHASSLGRELRVEIQDRLLARIASGTTLREDTGPSSGRRMRTAGRVLCNW